MPRIPSSFRPVLENLECRLTPAVTISEFASVGGGPIDSVLITGDGKANKITITDFAGGGVTYLSGATPLVPPTVTDPVIIRLNLKGGADELDYLVPTAVSLGRKIEYIGGKGANRFLLDTAATGGTGVDLLAGSFLSIDYDGSKGRVKSFVAHFDTVTTSTLDFNWSFGGGNDRDVAVIFGGAIAADTSVTGIVSLGGGSAPGGTISNEFALTVGASGSVVGLADAGAGTTIAFDVLGGGKADEVKLLTGFGTFGGGAVPAEVRFNANLGGGKDRFTHTNTATPSFAGQASLEVTVHGAGGKDRLLAENMGGTLILAEDARFDLNLFGDGGNDRVEVDFDTLGPGDFLFGPTALARVRADGGAGKDTVTVKLSNTATSSMLGIWDVQVLGSLGADKMGLVIDDLVAGDVLYQGGAALLDGGLGANKLLGGFPAPGPNVTVINV